MKWLILLLLASNAAFADPLRIAIIDTGLNIEDVRFKGHICASGHKDFTDTTLNDTVGHGTHVAGLIQQYAGHGDYCFIILKAFKGDGLDGPLPSYMAFTYVTQMHIALVNYSAGGKEPSLYEYETIKRATDIGTTFVVASGNEGKELNKEHCNYYPSCYHLANVHVIGNWEKKFVPNKSSNFGEYVERWEIGTNVKSTLPDDRVGSMTGSSMSAGIFSGKLIKSMLRNR